MSKHSSTPGEKNKQSITPQEHADQEHDPAKGQVPIIAHVDPTPVKADQTKHRRYRTFEWWKARLEILAIGAGVGYAIITYFQWQDLRDNFKVDQRAWVTAAKFFLKEKPSEGKPIKVDFVVVNNGKTPALHCRVEKIPIVDKLGPSCDPWRDGPKTPHLADFVLMPGVDAERGDTEPWQEAGVVSQYNQPGFRLYVQVKIWYDDAFGKSHWTTICRWHDSMLDANDFRPCTIGNEIDNSEHGEEAGACPGQPTAGSSPSYSGPSATPAK